MGIGEGFKVVENDVVRAVSSMQVAADFVFVDPPYAKEELYVGTLEALAESSVLRPDSLLVVEHDKRFDPGKAFGTLNRTRMIKQGDSGLSLYRRG